MISIHLYEEISQDLQKAISQGKYGEGGRLPSIKTLQTKYNCSKGTIVAAYRLLESEHIVYVKPRSGYFVADSFLRIPRAKSDFFKLNSGTTRVDSFSLNEAKHCLNIAVDLYQNNSLAIDLKGYPSLLKQLVKYLAAESIYCKPDHLFLTQGITQILSVLVHLDFPNKGKTILIEEPSYSFFVSYLKQQNVPVKTISRTATGINLAELEKIFKTGNIKFFYLIPRNHNPLGTTLSYQQRLSIVQLAHKYNVYLVEDDYFSESFFIPKYQPLYYFSEFKNCLYLKSYSKLMPYIRIGFAIVPDELLELFSKSIEGMYFTSYSMPSLVSQATLEAAIQNNILLTNADRISTSLHKMWSIIRLMAQGWNPDILRWIGDGSGLYSSFKLHQKIPISKFLNQLKSKKVLVAATRSHYYHLKNYDNSFRISLSQIEVSEIEEVMTIIYETATEIYENQIQKRE